jgi:hypothetical protein
LILGMLAQGIPLTLLPDLAWPAGLEREAADEADPPHGPHGRHAGRTCTTDSLQHALAFSACPSGRHRRDSEGCSPDDSCDSPTGRTDFSGGPVAC